MTTYQEPQAKWSGIGSREWPPKQKREALQLIQQGIVIAHEESLFQTAKSLEESRSRLEDDDFRICLFGRFKTGKSTTGNALLGPIIGADGIPRGPMKTAVQPCTAVLTTVNYAKEPSVQAVMNDGSIMPWRIDQYLHLSSLRNRKVPEELINVVEFRVSLPVPLCRDGVQVQDCPGTDEDRERQRIALRAARLSDAMIVLLSQRSLLGMQEQRDLAEASVGTTKRFFVVNLDASDKSQGEQELARTAAISVLTEPNDEGAVIEPADCIELFLVDAKQAEEARIRGDEQMANASGIAKLEDRLREFLETDRLKAHLVRHLSGCALQIRGIESALIGTRSAAQSTASTDETVRSRDIIEQELEEARRETEQCRKDLNSVRSKALEVHSLFDKHTPEIVLAYQSGMRRFMETIPEQLPTIVESFVPANREEEGRTIFKRMKDEFGYRWNLSFKPNIVTQKIQEHIESEIAARADRALDKGSPELTNAYKGLHSDMQKLGEEAAKAIADARTRRFDLSATERAEMKIELADRIGGCVAGVLMGSPLDAFFGAQGGLRGAASGAIGGAVTLAALAALSTIIPITLPVAAVGVLIGMVAGRLGIDLGQERRARKEVVRMLQVHYNGLIDSLDPKIDQQVKIEMNDLRAKAYTAVDTAIQSEIEKVEKELTASEKTEGEKRLEVARINAQLVRIADILLRLRSLEHAVETGVQS